MVVVGGGDGTVATAAGKLMAGRTRLWAYCRWARSTSTPRISASHCPLSEAVPLLARGRIRPMDVGDVNGTVFLNHSVLGLYPMMVQEREEVRRPGLEQMAGDGDRHVQGAETISPADGPAANRHGTRRITTPYWRSPTIPMTKGFGAFLKRSHLDTGQLALYVAKHRHRCAWRDDGGLGAGDMAARRRTGGHAADRIHGEKPPPT